MNKKILKSIEEHEQLVGELKESSIETIRQAAELICKAIKDGGCVYICGNGGSAADAQHIAGEIVGRFLRERKGLPAAALSTDTSVITSVANDYGYEDIFVRQVEALCSENDLLWAISTSGTSGNIIKAVEKAKEIGAKVLGFAGKKGSKLEELSNVCLTTNGSRSYNVQQIHQIAYHIICDLVEENFCEG